MLLSLASLLLLVGSVTASWEGNINYRSPSERHASLGIDISKVLKRSSGVFKRDADPDAPQPGTSSWSASELNFTHGVASGDPWPNSVILWTRISPMMANDESNVTVEGTAPLYNHETEQYIDIASKRACVEYVVSTDEKLSKVITKGTAYTTSDIDFTVKVEARRLKPWTTYYYQFSVCGSSNKSPLGRTKTAPRLHQKITHAAIAVFSCSNYPNGYFNAYGNAARNDRVDYFIHLGDYIYEGGVGVLGKDPRATAPEDAIFTLFDYRTRLAEYRTDLDLSLAHQNFAWIPVWDDHEISNNGWRDGSSGLNNTEDSFRNDGGVSVDQRKMNAVRAYFEWMPIRQVDMDDNLRIWRTFSIGSLFDLIMLDTRNYDRSITTLGWNDDYIYEISNDAGRTLMGSHQETWFYRQLSNSNKRGATWRVIGNQIVFSRINVTSWFGTSENPYNGDQWDGYMANRNRTLQHMYSNNIGNNIMLAGDSHANWVSDLVWLDEEKYDSQSGAGAIGVEFAGTAVSSTGFDGTIRGANNQASLLVRDNEELQWQEGYYRGYFELHITPDSATARYYGCPTVAERNAYEVSLANFTVKAGANRLNRPIAGGSVYSGATLEKEYFPSNLTYNTETKQWSTIGFDTMFIEYE
ncbi:alkaline phosphatase [Rhizodiscina lignyota]|uniref:Alkaline phosphatase n=1 Tax=Rhizodiscina lignyota TaxID=1504668 RepID=A0A9P4M365_9PEZI|nr:alkaline phosphatase [Rhizodiscina lignyota]